MKKYYFLIILTVILGLVLTGCSLLSNVGQVPATEQSGIAYLTKGAETSPDEYELYAGQDILVGNVNVWNDGVELHVTYNTTDGWVLTETHLAVATALGVIPQKNGNPIPGKFPYQCCYDEDEGEWVFQIKEGGALGATCDADENTNTTLTEVEYIIPLSGIGVVGVGADDILYIAAHAKVIRPIEDCWETVWQIGDVEVNDGFGQLTNYCDEFNYAGFYEGLGPLYPPFTDPFVVGTTFTNMFPWLSLGSYATDFKVQWFGELLFGGKLTVSWSPGTSATETKIIMSIDDGVPFTFVVNGFDDPSGWLGYPLVQSNLELNPIGGGSHEIRFQHTTGDGAIWDWVRLEKPCEQEESAWADGPGFTGKNWATYFKYTVQGAKMLLWNSTGEVGVGYTCAGGAVKIDEGPYGFVFFNIDASNMLFVEFVLEGATANANFKLYINQVDVDGTTCMIKSPNMMVDELTTDGQGNGNAYFNLPHWVDADKFWVSAMQLPMPYYPIDGRLLLRSEAVVLD